MHERHNRYDQEQAYRMRVSGASPLTIADKLDIPVRLVFDYCARMAAELAGESIDVSRSLDIIRLDEAYHAIRCDILAGDHSAIASMLKIMDRRAKLLGLDTPARSDIKISSDMRDLSEDELIAIIESEGSE